MTDPWILCVDDEPKVLEGLELQLGFDFEVRTAIGGEAGLEMLRANKDCAVIISDMRMPGMDGAKFLAASRELSPDTTRMLLTGYSEVSSAISAINDGGIFRFLTKPTPPDVMKTAIDEAMRQWELIQSERVLLEQTLHGAVEALIEALEIASPSAFSRARRIESASRHVARELRMQPVWEVALAGLLLRLGWIAIPASTVDSYLAGKDLTEAEATMFTSAYATSVRLVGRIPRLENVAATIRDARQPSGLIDAPTVVRAVSEFDHLCHLGTSVAKALKTLDGAFPREILVALSSWEGNVQGTIVREVRLTNLTPGMVAAGDIVTLSGNLLVRAGTDLTHTVIQRLRNFATSQGVKEPISVAAKA